MKCAVYSCEFRTLVGLTALVCFGPGCSDSGNKDTWYQDAQDGVQNRDSYIQSQVNQGIDPAEARKQYDLNGFILKTEGRDPATTYQQSGQ